MLERLASHSKIQMKTLFFLVETTIKKGLDRNLETLNQRHNRHKSLKLKMYVFKKTVMTAAFSLNSFEGRNSTD